MRDIPHVPGLTLFADVFIAPNDPVGIMIAQHPATVFSHFHDFYEIGFVLEGRGRHTTDEGSQPIQRGHALFVAPGVAHGFERGEGLVLANCFLRGEVARIDLAWAQRDARLARLFAPGGMPPTRPVLLELDAGELAECLAHLDAIRDRSRTGRGHAFELAHLLLVLDLLARHLEMQEQTERHEAVPAVAPLVAGAMALVEQDLCRHWTLDELAGALAVDPFHLVRLFKRGLGMPPIAWANQQRAQRAAALLAATDEPIAVVGAQVGWPDPSHFSRRFRHEMGVSAREYRALIRERHGQGIHGPAAHREAWSPPADPEP